MSADQLTLFKKIVKKLGQNDACALIIELMKQLNNDQSGFIPLLITVILIVLAGIFLVYTRVLHAQQ